ncbi:hypothetical protein EVAR_15987_1 [Eumeta japonica]|uniref:Uncharacterized protein n=1 Tax=Eumeta variegata TaxID=151549 RepID=A0A4C1UMV6_EUMVA|nr:hypothetical protein EVAR_15987_1 [Eumeta japonica]
MVIDIENTYLTVDDFGLLFAETHASNTSPFVEDRRGEEEVKNSMEEKMTLHSATGAMPGPAYIDRYQGRA